MTHLDFEQLPLVSVVIPTTGQSPHLRGLLERLQRQKMQPDRPAANVQFEVLVIANLPRQDLRNLVKSMDRVSASRFEYLETGKLGVNLARNKGLERAKGEIILFLDDDAILDGTSVPPEHFLAAHYQKHLQNPEAVAIGGPYHLVGSKSKWDLAYQHIAAHWLKINCRSQNRTEQLLGGNISLKSIRIRALNERFDEVVPYGGSETGLCQRLVGLGETLLYFDELKIGHAPGLNRISYMRKAYLQGAGSAWRETHIGNSRFLGPDSLRPRDERPELRNQVALYDRCFQYGNESAPFQNDLVKNSQISFPHLSYPFYLIRRSLRNLIQHGPIAVVRRVYSASRSIWVSARY